MRDEKQPEIANGKDKAEYGNSIAPEFTFEDAGAYGRPTSRQGLREWISRAFGRVEDVVYVGLGLLLAGSAMVLLVSGALSFGRSLFAGTLPGNVVDLLDRILLILMIVEILYTVQVSFRQHTLAPEPFLIVGLIAATRRILILTAEFARLLEKGEAALRNAMVELGLLTVLIVALVACLFMLRKRYPDATAHRRKAAVKRAL